MQHEHVAICLAELGHSHRLAILRFIIQQRSAKATVGDIQNALNIPASTLSHHLNRLSQAKLITQEKQGRHIICSPNHLQISALMQFLNAEFQTVQKIPYSLSTASPIKSELKKATVIPGY